MFEVINWIIFGLFTTALIVDSAYALYCLLKIEVIRLRYILLCLVRLKIQ